MEINYRINIKQSIIICFLVIIIVFVCSVFYGIHILKKNEATINKMIEIQEPSSKAVNELNLLLIKSANYTTDFAYHGANEEDKDSLKRLIFVTYPALRKEIKKLRLNWTNQQAILLSDSIFYEFESQSKNFNKVLILLANSSTDENSAAIANGRALLTTYILPNNKLLSAQLNKLYRYTVLEKDKNLSEINAFNDAFREKIFGFAIIIVLFICFVGLIYNNYTQTKITEPIMKISKVIEEISKGEINEVDIEIEKQNTLIGNLSVSVFNLKNGLHEAIRFSNEIGQAKFDTDFKILSEKDSLGISLLQMRENLIRFNEAEKQRNWASEGISKFSEILRLNNQNLKNLSSKVIIELVNYIGGNQGGFFVINNDDETNVFIELKACYAYQREKLIRKQIPIDEGIIGQCIAGKETIYITDIPASYIEITSGLGNSSPNSILLVPLKASDEVYGVIELASFKLFRDFEIAFVEKLAESIATTVSEAQLNAKTQDLLEQMQMQTEQLKAQEEEMRQNMEELMATQEQMMRQNA